MMKLTRRSFLKKSAAVGTLSLAGEGAIRHLLADSSLSAATGKNDIVAVTGQNPYANTVAAIENLGGIGAFVGRGDTVGLLVNSPFRNFGASVNPDVALAVIKLCADAGVKEIRYLKDPHKGYWERTPTAAGLKNEMKLIKYESGDRRKVKIPAGVKLKDAKVTEDLFACNRFINVSIAKHHDGVHYSGALKNMMGLCPFTTNSYFHFGGKLEFGFYGDVDHLSQCIADLNLVRQPELCIADATAVITENGPYGPGRILKARKVVAAANPVSLDAYGCTLLGHRPPDILAVAKAAAHKLGEMRLDRLRIQAVKQ